MARTGVRIALVGAAAAALWLAAGAARADTEIPVRLPYVPAESLPATEVPGPSSGVSLRVDPGDNEAPDPTPKLVIVIRD